MRTTIDGRVVVPKAARDELGLTAGTELELRVVDRRLEIEVPTIPMRLEEDQHGLVAVTDREKRGPGCPLTPRSRRTRS